MTARSAAVAALSLALLGAVACGRASGVEVSPEPPAPGDWVRAVESAVAGGGPAAVEALLASGVEPDRILPIAAARNGDDVLRLLFARGADPHGFEASRALFAALAGEHAGAEAVLSEAGVTLDAADRQGRTQVHTAAAKGHTADLRRLLKFGADGNRATGIGVSPLMSAAGEGRGRAVELLLAAAVDVDARDDDGWTALHYAAREGESAIGLRLVEVGATVTAVSDLGWTALHLASRAGAGDLVAALLAAGADPHVATRAAGTALQLAIRSGDRASVLALLAAGADPGEAVREADARWWAERLGDDEMVRRLGGSR